VSSWVSQENPASENANSWAGKASGRSSKRVQLSLEAEDEVKSLCLRCGGAAPEASGGILRGLRFWRGTGN